MWRKTLAWTVISGLILCNIPIVSYAAETDSHIEVEMDENQKEGHTEAMLENIDLAGNYDDAEDGAAEENPDEAIDEAVSYDDTGETVYEETRESQSDAALPQNEGIEQDSTSAIQVQDITVYTDNLSVQENTTGEYVPYENAKYKLCYEVVNGEICITGIAGYESKEDLGELVIPEKIGDMPVTLFSKYAFDGCSGFTGNLIIPGSVREIGYGAFSGCSGFDGNLTIPENVTVINGYTFSGCSGFTGNLTIPSGVTTIGHHAFSGCSGLVGSLVIPESVIEISYGAFDGCSGFDGNLTIPGNVTVINGYTFSGCSGFTGNLTIPSGVTAIGDSAFANCSGFTGNLTIPENVSEIGNSSFDHCSGLGGKVIIPESVVEIGEDAFYACGFTEAAIGAQKVSMYGFWGCQNLRNVEIAASVKEIGLYAFDNTLKSIQIITFLGCDTQIHDFNTPSFGNIVRGHRGSTAESYAQKNNGNCLFVPIENVTDEITEVRVSNTEELEAAIGSYEDGGHRRIILADGIYKTYYPFWIVGLPSMTIEAEHPGKAEILSTATYDTPVIMLDRCIDFKIAGCIIGHSEIYDYNGEMVGDILSVRNSYNVNIEHCDLQGCGSTGILLNDSEEVTLSDCIIRDCMQNIVDNQSWFDSDNLKIRDCVISNTAYENTNAKIQAAISGSGRNILENCLFINNYNTVFSDTGDGKINITDCSFYNNAWDAQLPKNYGICLNGITWQVEGDVLRIGYPLQLDADTVIQSEQGEVLDYSDSALPWKRYKKLNVDVAPGVQYRYGNPVNIHVSGIDIDVLISMTEEEQAAYAAQLAAKEGITLEDGDDVSVEIVIGNAENVLSTSDKAAIDRYISGKGLALGQYLDVTMILQAAGEVRQITQAAAPVRLVIEVPESLRQSGRMFFVLRLHDGELSRLKDLDDSPDTITIETDRFSSYTIIYREAGSGFSVSGKAASFGDISDETILALLDVDGNRSAT